LDQYRLKVGDLEVTSLYDGAGRFETNWLSGTKAVMADIVNTLEKQPHFLDAADSGFRVNTGKQVVLVPPVLAGPQIKQWSTHHNSCIVHRANQIPAAYHG